MGIMGSISSIGTLGTVGTTGTMENGKKMKLGSRNLRTQQTWLLNVIIKFGSLMSSDDIKEPMRKISWELRKKKEKYDS